ncbi:MAG: TetR/AcrR family transcriptional regulator [Acutalibacteraceae bacterium]
MEVSVTGRNSAVNELKRISCESIELALLQLMKFKSFETINITEITKLAGVSRNAFYRNFNSKEDVIKQYCESVTKSFFDSVEEKYTYNYYVRLLYHFQNQHEAIQIILDSNLIYILIDVFSKYTSIPDNNIKRKPYTDSYAAGGMLFVVLRWLKLGMPETPEELAKTIISFKISNTKSSHFN